MKKLILVFCLFFCAFASQKVFSQNNLCFNQPSCSPFPTNTLPNDIVSADFNLDGKNDLAVEIQGVDSITILLGNNNGDIRSRQRFEINRRAFDYRGFEENYAQLTRR